ncbi:MAG TPA: choice-of-anchor Q domain-containing protein, partial [Caldilineaceae bacterium]|nr:choice-of-anchor Q domain-containing protein [Caldilineaceae bacterium]
NRTAEKVFFANSGSLTLRGMALVGGVLNSEAAMTLEEVAISGANGQEPNYGGGLYNVRGTTTVRNSSITGNHATRGGGVFNGGTLTMVNVTVSGNRASAAIGGIDNQGTATLTHVTISGNRAESEAGGLGIGAGAVTTVGYTLIAGNAVGSGQLSVDSGQLDSQTVGQLGGGAVDCVGNLTSAGHNLIGSGCGSSLGGSDLAGVDARLEPLALNGAETLTVALGEGSPALDVGESAVEADQRGAPRDGAADVGAFERGGVVPGGVRLYLPVVAR